MLANIEVCYCEAGERESTDAAGLSGHGMHLHDCISDGERGPLETVHCAQRNVVEQVPVDGRFRCNLTDDTADVVGPGTHVGQPVQ